MSHYRRNDVLQMIETLKLDVSHLEEREHKKLIAEALFKSSYMPLNEALVKAYEHIVKKEKQL